MSWCLLVCTWDALDISHILTVVSNEPEAKTVKLAEFKDKDRTGP